MSGSALPPAPVASAPKAPSASLRRLFRLLLILFNLLLLGGFYLGTVAWRSWGFQARHSRWEGQAYRAHKRYGYFPQRRALAYHSLEHGQLVPVRFDAAGYRVPARPRAAPVGGPRLLFLGDSFTHGYGVAAEKTFPFLTARKVGAEALNAGVSGWGLAQIVLRARAEIPKVRPDVVVVQHSSWLASRSMAYFSPTRGTLVPSPYFSGAGEQLTIRAPVFTSSLFRLPASESSAQGFWPFFRRVGLPLFAHEDLSLLRTAARRAVGRLPRPASSETEVLRFAYGEIARLCREQGAELVVLVLPHRIRDQAPELPGVPPEWVVATHTDLSRWLPEPTRDAWERAYQLWGGDPPRLVDRHPNPRMHAAIAKILARALDARLKASRTPPG